MSDLMRRIARRARMLIRPVYVRFPILQRMRHTAGGWKMRVSALTSSRDRHKALQALTERRFNPAAVINVPQDGSPGTLPGIDVSVVSFNSAQWVPGFFKSLIAQAYPLHKIHLRIVDHGSQDDTLDRLRTALKDHEDRFGSVSVIEQDNVGFGAGHARAIQAGHGPFCLVTNLDLEFRQDSIVNVVLAAVADVDEQVASWELRQIPYEHPKYYDPVTLETNWSSHACILIRRSAYEQVGGYDPRLFMYAEDVELSYRFRSYGYALKYVPSAVVHHYTYETAGEIKPLQYSGSTVGNVYVRLRYGSRTDRIAGLFLYALLIFRPAPCPGAKKALLRNGVGIFRNWKHFSKGRGTADAYFPFRIFDYDFRREGDFFEVKPMAGKGLPVVSIVTRTYAGRDMFLAQAIQSIFNQTYPAIELVVAEDGGNTQQNLVTSMAAQAPENCNVRYLACPKLGRSHTGNAGLAAATGTYLMFLDDDDLLFADHVEILASTLQGDSGLSAAYALALEVHTGVDADKQHYSEVSYETPAVFHQEWDHDVLRHHNFIPIQSILFRRELYDQRGGFDVTLDQLEDWNLWLRYGHGNQFVFVPKTTSLFRSPADVETRKARALMLDAAYIEAQQKAFQATRQ